MGSNLLQLSEQAIRWAEYADRLARASRRDVTDLRETVAATHRILALSDGLMLHSVQHIEARKATVRTLLGLQ